MGLSWAEGPLRGAAGVSYMKKKRRCIDLNDDSFEAYAV